MANPPPSTSDDTAKLSWINLIDESVHTSDDIDIGDIDAKQRLCSCKKRVCKYTLLLYSND